MRMDLLIGFAPGVAEGGAFSEFFECFGHLLFGRHDFGLDLFAAALLLLRLMRFDLNRGLSAFEIMNGFDGFLWRKRLCFKRIHPFEQKDGTDANYQQTDDAKANESSEHRLQTH